MTETYLVGATAQFDISEENQGGQTFTPTETHTLYFIDLDLTSGLFTAPIMVRVYRAGDDHKPYGDSLAFGKVDPPSRVPPGVSRFRFEMKPAPLLYAGYKYCIVATQGHILLGTQSNWRFDHFDSQYPRGLRVSSLDDGATWSVHYGQDHMFAEMGDPYSPPTPPIPPITSWIITNIWYYHYNDGLRIVVSTDVPCHLHMYWTTTPPRKHTAPRMRRGEPWTDTLNYCFVTWDENEQQEAGDTLIHTFLKPWPVCETRYMVFRATINGNWSTSISPIFTHHRLAPTTHTTTFEALGISGFLESQAATYALARYANSGSVSVDTNSGTTGQSKEGAANFFIWRAGLFFNTTSIPLAASIISAKLILRVQFGGIFSAIHDADQCLTVVPAGALAITGLEPSDFGTLLGATLDYGHICRDDWLAGGHASLAEIELSLDYNPITGGGITKLALRGSHDIDNVPDVIFIERNRFDYQLPKLAQTGWAWLEVTYSE